ncbi:Vacuolar fusion protein MON1 [Hypsizygus marmoreus]|uniref:Vacuolar fusion protein MON1 n=1 Tax=Hypsizygus marmoreus TaxID=39966 RepID=A0A369J716_HYPMA|nr:Vacuolar fusion protein MON1 [Hypsizygus marmoreus]
MSRTPSGSGPGLSKTPPSRLAVPPTIRPSPSLSNLHIHSHAVESAVIPPSQSQNPALDSTASSVFNLDLNEGIMIQDVDAETESAEDITVMSLESDIDRGEEDSKKTLRDQLRKTLSHKTSRSDTAVARSHLKREVDELPFEAVSRYPPRQYFVLTDAGKPVFTSQPDGDNVAATIGVMQALISVFLDDNDKLRCINAGRTRITFILRSPLYYACASSWGEPESVTRSHLDYLHLQILSIVTAAQLRRIFERRTNFDLRRLLNGAEGFLTSLLERLEFDLAISTSSLQCLKLDPHLRKRVAEALLPTSKIKDILYIMLVARGKVVTLIRPRKHSIHPADIHIILNTVHSPSIFNSPASSSWIPLCLPKFNPSGFVNAYISFLRRDGHSEAPDESKTPTSEAADPTTESLSSEPTPTQAEKVFSYPKSDQSGTVLVCISGGGEFDVIRGWFESVTLRLDKEGTLDAIANASTSGEVEYSVSDLGIPGLRHFVYKSRSQVQVTIPVFEDPYDLLEDRKRLITLYQTLHDAIHAKSGQMGTLKLQYIRTDKESVMGWITQPFELYIAVSPLLPKTAIVGAANAVARWVKKEEGKLFLRDAPVF